MHALDSRALWRGLKAPTVYSTLLAALIAGTLGTPVQAQEAPAQTAPAPAPNVPDADPWLLHTRDGRFTLKFGALIQMRYMRSDAEKRSEQNTFKVQVVRPQLRATLGKPWITVFIQSELANVPQLLDLELTLHPHPSFGLKVGQFLTPFSRTFFTPVPKLLFQDFSEANAFFRADRQTGAMLFGTPFHGILEYYCGAFNGNRINQSGNDDDKLLFLGRLAVNPLGAVAYDETPALAGAQPFRFAVGVNGYWGRVPHVPPNAPAFPRAPTTPDMEADLPDPRDETQTVGVDLLLHWWLVSLQAEWYHRDLTLGASGQRVRAQGGYVHLSGFLWWPYLETAARLSVVDPNELTRRDQTVIYEGALNLYGIGNHLKLHLRYAHFERPASMTGERPAANQYLAQTQWYF